MKDIVRVRGKISNSIQAAAETFEKEIKDIDEDIVIKLDDIKNLQAQRKALAIALNSINSVSNSLSLTPNLNLAGIINKVADELLESNTEITSSVVRLKLIESGDTGLSIWAKRNHLAGSYIVKILSDRSDLLRVKKSSNVMDINNSRTKTQPMWNFKRK